MSEPESAPQKDYKKIYSLGVLHMAQYFPQGFTQTGLPAIFRQQGLPLNRFWLISSLPLWPRWIKFLVAMVVDNFGSERFGYRRSWILPCTLISAVLYLSLAFVQPMLSTVGLIAAILLVKSLFMTAQDVAVDAYCSESFTETERPSGASILAFLASLGNFLGTGIVALVDSIGWSPTMVLAAVLLLAAATPAILRPEPPPPPALRRRRERGEPATFVKTLRRRDAALIMPHCFAAGWVDSFAFTMVAPFLIDHQMTLTTYGIFIPTIGILGRGSAAYVVPKVIARFGQNRAALVGALGFVGEGAYYTYLSVRGELPPLWRLILIVAALNFLYMHYVMSFGTSRFRWASKSQAGTDYSTQSSFYFLGVSAGGGLSGFAAAAFGYTPFFIVSFAIATAIAVAYSLSLRTVDALVDAREAALAEQTSAPIEG